MIPFVVVQQGPSQVAGPHQDQLLIEIHTQLLIEDVNQPVHVIAVPLLAQVSQKRKIAPDGGRLDIHKTGQFPGHDSLYAVFLKPAQRFQVERCSVAFGT